MMPAGIPMHTVIIVLQTVIKYGPVCVNEPDNYEARAAVMWAGTLAHNGQLGVGRQDDWTSHQMGHELSALYDATHGATLAMLIPQWLRYCLPGQEMRIAQFAVRVFDVPETFGTDEEIALEGIARLEAFYRSIGMTTTLHENNIGEENIDRMAERAAQLVGGTVGNFVKLSADDCKAIYRLAL